MEFKRKAEKLITYISATYGLNNLGNFRALSSLHTFRYLVSKNKQSKPMFSFESAIAKYHATYLRRGRDGIASVVSIGGVDQLFDDDKFGTVCGAVQDKLFALYPELKTFPKTPVVQMGHGCNVRVVVDDFKRQQFEADFLPQLSAHPDYHDLATRYDSVAAMVTADTPMNSVHYMQLFQAVHDIFRKLRVHGVADFRNLPVVDLPFADLSEEGGVMRGRIRKSLRDPEGFDDTTLLALSKHFGNAYRLESNGTEWILTEPNPFFYIGADNLSLPATSRCQLECANNSDEDEEVLFEDAVAGPVDATEPPTKNVAGKEALQQAMAHMLHYMGADRSECKKLQKLAPAEQVIAQYGSEEGWRFCKMLKPSEKREVLKLFRGRGKIEPADWLNTGAQYLGTLPYECQDEVVYLKLVAGLTYSSANHMVYKLTGCDQSIIYN